MRKLALIMGLGALLSLAPMAACAPDFLKGAVADAATAASHTTPAQSNSVAALGDAYVLVANAATVYVKVAHPPQATKDHLRDLNDGAYKVLQDMRAADKRGDSPAVALAMKAWTDKFGALKAFLTQLGVPLPSGT